VGNLLKNHLRHAFARSACINLLALAPTIYLLQVYDRVLTSRSLETLAMLALFAAIALTTLLFQEIARGHLLGRAAAALDLVFAPAAIAARVSERAGITPPRPADIQEDLAAVRGFLSGPGCIALFDAPWMILYLLVIFAFHWSLGLMAMLSAALLIALAVSHERGTGYEASEHKRLRRRAEHLSQEIVANAETVAAMGVTVRLQQARQALQQGASQGQTVMSERSHRYKCVTRWVRQLIQVVMMALGAWLVIEERASGGVMLATTILLGKALAPIEQLIGNWKQLTAARGAWPRCEALLGQSATLQPTALPSPHADLRAEGVVFVSSQDGKAILQGINFHLRAGETLAITGPSGAGKTTLTKVLIGLWKPRVGTVRLDNADISQWPREALSDYLGYMPQEITLLTGSVADNIACRYSVPVPAQADSMTHAPTESIDLAPTRHDQESSAIVSAARRAHAHEMILRLPQGYETQTGPPTAQLSGGQRRLVGLARALHGNPRLVILDEPDASLDAQGDQMLQATLRQLKAARVTVIIVTRSPRLLALADKMLVLREGRMERFGPRLEVERWISALREAQSAEATSAAA
jgi:ATP-binding cassette subfamily C protein EexD